MEWDGLFVATRDDVYEPHDDTFLLARVAEEQVQPGDRFLETGCGAGVVALAAARGGATVTVTDRNPAAVRLAIHNGHQNGHQFAGIQGDLLAGVRGPFDMVAFNPPYLPTADDEHVTGPLDWAFDGGPDGNAVVLRFAGQLQAASWTPREVLVVHSSLSEPAALDEAMRELGYDGTVAARERHNFEELTVRRYLAVQQTS